MENDGKSPHLVRISQGTLEKVFRLNQDEFTLGRGPTATIRIESNLISSEHLSVRIRGTQVSIRDLSSKHGTFIHGKKIEAGTETILRSIGEEIHLGNIVTVTIKPREVAVQPAAAVQEKEVSIPALAMASGGGGTSLKNLFGGKPRVVELAQELPAADASKPELVPASATSAPSESLPAGSVPAPPPFAKKFPPRPDVTSPSLRLVTDVEYETEILKAGAARFAEGLKEESRREANLIINEAKQKKEKIDQERERVEEAIMEMRAEFESLNSSRGKIQQENIRFQTEIKKFEGVLAELNSRKSELELETSSLLSKIAGIREEMATAETKRQESLAEIQELQATAGEIRQSVNDAKAHQEMLMADLKSKHLTYEATVGRLEAQRDSLQREIQEHQDNKNNWLQDAENIKSQAEKEVKAAEEKTRTFELESKKIKELIEDQHRTLDGLRTQTTEIRNTLVNLETEKEKLIYKNEAERLDIESETKELKAQIDTLKARREQLNTEYNKAVDANNRKIADSKSEIQKLKTELREMQRALDTSRADTEEAKNNAMIVESRAVTADENLARLKQETAASEARNALLSRELADMKLQREAELAELTAQRDSIHLSMESDAANQRQALSLELTNAKQKSEAELAQLVAERDAIRLSLETEANKQREALTRELADMKQTAEKEIMELTAKQDSIRLATQAEATQQREALSRELADLKQKSEKELSELNMKRELVRLTTESEASKQREALTRELTELKIKSERELAELSAKRDLIRVNMESEATHQRETLSRELTEMKQKSERELAELIAKRESTRLSMDSEAAQQREALTRELTDLKQSVETEIRELIANRDTLKVNIDSETAKLRESLERELANRRSHYDRELEDTRKAKLEQIEKLADQAKAEEKNRRAHILEEIILGAIEMEKKGSLVNQEDDFRDMVFAAMAGKTAATLSAKAAQRTRAFWRKMGLGALGPALILLTLAIFPHLLQDIKVSLRNKADYERKESGSAFMDDIRSHGQIFQPDKMDQVYRKTYTDNIIYLTGYVDMKRSDDKQKEWTLLLNDFITGRLGLSDRVIPEFVSTETVMIQNLIEVRKTILPQFKEQGLQRMADIENREVSKLQSILQTPENYAKFRDLEKSFYAEYMSAHPEPAHK